MSARIASVLRTPAARFRNLPGWHFGRPAYFTSQQRFGDVRMAYWDLEPEAAHTGETVLLTHGNPTWSYLNRRLVRPLLERGHRVVLFDQVGCGQSDKPADVSDYTYDRHVMWNEDLLCNHLNLSNVTALMQDWGGLIGLRVAANHPARFDRLVISNTILPTCDVSFEGEAYVGQGFYDW